MFLFRVCVCIVIRVNENFSICSIRLELEETIFRMFKISANRKNSDKSQYSYARIYFLRQLRGTYDGMRSATLLSNI